MRTLISKRIIGLLLTLSIVGIIGYFFYTHFNVAVNLQGLPPSNSEKTITIGWIGPLTGETKWLGMDGLKATELTIQQYNQSKAPNEPAIQLLIANSPLGSKAAEKAYAEMVYKKKVKLLFVVSSDDTRELAKQALKDDVIIINPLNNDRTLANLNPNIFLIAKTTESLSSIIADRMIAEHQRKALVVYSTDQSFIVTLAKGFEGAFRAAGGQTLMRPYSVLTTTDFKSILAEGEAQHADAYVFFGTPEVGLAMKQARDMGIKKNFYSTNNINNPTTISNAKNAIEGVQFSDFTYRDGNPSLAKKFLIQFETQYLSKPQIEWTALQAHDAVAISIVAIHRAITEEGDFSKNIRNALLSIRDYEGVSGNITIRPDGTSEGIYPGMYIFKAGTPEKLP